MPWTAKDAERHTHKANSETHLSAYVGNLDVSLLRAETLRALWAKVANETLERTGDEGRAIREANAVVARQSDETK
ncbi:hypothetical protein [Acidocella facilis]|uniref:hypothetical protein n=1 Tax=Acidocella facilis TaxID=525 RepID=UPI00047B6FD3|nr:hypothetical protein [Acidocella facilis]